MFFHDFPPRFGPSALRVALLHTFIHVYNVFYVSLINNDTGASFERGTWAWRLDFRLTFRFDFFQNKASNSTAGAALFGTVMKRHLSTFTSLNLPHISTFCEERWKLSGRFNFFCLYDQTPLRPGAKCCTKHPLNAFLPIQSQWRLAEASNATSNKPPP